MVSYTDVPKLPVFAGNHLFSLARVKYQCVGHQSFFHWGYELPTARKGKNYG